MAVYIPCDLSSVGSRVVLTVPFSDGLRFEAQTLEAAAQDVADFYSAWWAIRKSEDLRLLCDSYVTGRQVFVQVSFWHQRERMFWLGTTVLCLLLVYLPFAGLWSWYLASWLGGAEFHFPVEGGEPFISWVYAFSYLCALGFLLILIVWLQLLFPRFLNLMESVFFRFSFLMSLYRILVQSWLMIGLEPENGEKGVKDEPFPTTGAGE